MHYDGDVIDLPESEARRVIANGFGEEVGEMSRETKPIRTAATGPNQNASTRPAGPQIKPRRKGSAA